MKGPDHKVLLMSEQIIMHGRVTETVYTLKQLKEAEEMAELMKELEDEGINFNF